MVQPISFKGGVFNSVTKESVYDTNRKTDIRKLNKMLKISLSDIVGIEPHQQGNTQSTVIRLSDSSKIEIADVYISQTKRTIIQPDTTKVTEYAIHEPTKGKNALYPLYEQVYQHLNTLIKAFKGSR